MDTRITGVTQSYRTYEAGGVSGEGSRQGGFTADVFDRSFKPGAPSPGSNAPADPVLGPDAAGDLFVPGKEESSLTAGLQGRGSARPSPEVRPRDFRLGLKDCARLAACPALVGGLNGALASIPVIGVPLSALFGGLLANAAAEMLQQKNVEPLAHQKVLNKAMTVGGAVALGAVAFAAPPLAVAGCWGSATFLLTLALTVPEAADKKKYQADEQADSGQFRTASLFRQAYREKGEGDVLLQAEVRAAEELEKAGWALGATRGDYRDHVRGGDVYVKVAAPGNKDRAAMFSFDMKLLPTLAALICGTGSGLEGDRDLIDTVHTLQKWEQRGVTLTPQYADSRYLEMAKGSDPGRLLNRVEVATYLKGLRDVSCLFGGNDTQGMNVSSPGMEGLETFMERLSRLADLSGEQEVLSRSLLRYQPPDNMKALSALLKELPGDEFPRHLGVLGELSSGASADGGYTEILKDYQVLLEARDAREPLEKSAADYGTLLSAFASLNRADETAPAYRSIRRCFSDGTFGTGERMEDHVAVVKELAPCDRGAKDQGYIMDDYRALMTERDRTMPLEKSLAEYRELLSGLASVNHAKEAAPTYAFIRRGITNKEFGSSDFHELCMEFLSNLLVTNNPEEARLALLKRRGAQEELSLEEADGVLVIDEVKIPIKGGK